MGSTQNAPHSPCPPSTRPAGASGRAGSPCSPNCRRICLAGSAGRSRASKSGDGGIVPASPSLSPGPPASPAPPPQLGSPVPAGIRTRLPAPRVPVQLLWQRLRAVPVLEGLCGDKDTRQSPVPTPSVRPGSSFAPGKGRRRRWGCRGRRALTGLAAALARLGSGVAQGLAGPALLQVLGAAAGQARGVCGHRG